MNLPQPGTEIKCINDKALPEGANVIEGKEYFVLSSRVNNHGQGIVFLEGVVNNGTTSRGLQWNGYDVKRFGRTLEDVLAGSEEEVEAEPALN